jgi:secreted PhoX family phosphatase
MHNVRKKIQDWATRLEEELRRRERVAQEMGCEQPRIERLSVRVSTTNPKGGQYRNFATGEMERCPTLTTEWIELS